MSASLLESPIGAAATQSFPDVAVMLNSSRLLRRERVSQILQRGAGRRPVEPALFLVWLGLGAWVPIRTARALEGAPTSLEVFVYAANCAMYHGIKGDGHGMAASMFRVQPRDFRQGLFKFRSTSSGSLPADHDLPQTVTQGIRWTGMVGRPDLSEVDRRAVVQYLKTSPCALPQSQALLEQGRRLYHEAECAQCHGERGRGDGPSATGLTDDWGWPTRPSDLAWRPLKRGTTLEGIYLTIPRLLETASSHRGKVAAPT
jgi:hypothetical protein